MNNIANDLPKVIGWFHTGTMEHPAGNVLLAKLTATVRLPKNTQPKGRTVLWKKPVVTNPASKTTAKFT